MSIDIEKQREFYEDMKRQAIADNDAYKLGLAESMLASLTDEVSGEVSGVAKKYDFAFDFNEHADSTVMNDIVQNLLDAQKAKIHKFYDETIGTLETDKRELSGKLESTESELQTALTEKAQYKLERDDFERRFNNSAEKIEELNGIIESLKRENETLKQPAAAQLPEASSDIEQSIDYQELMRLADEEKKRKAEEKLRLYKESRIKITNKRWTDEDNRKLRLAELVLDGPTGENPQYGLIGETGKAGDTIRFHYFDEGKYQEVSAAEAETFRSEQTAQHDVPDTTLDQPVIPVAPELTFRSSEDTERVEAQDNGGVQPDLGEVATEEDCKPVSKAEFESRVTNLEKGMEQLMRKVFGEVAA